MGVRPVFVRENHIVVTIFAPPQCLQPFLAHVQMGIVIIWESLVLLRIVGHVRTALVLLERIADQMDIRVYAEKYVRDADDFIIILIAT